jgi:mannose-6-phosphate isomerase-like protein (cupin superfamily)
MSFLPGIGKEFEFGKGDALLVPVGEPHQVENRSKEEATFVFSVAPRI